METPTRHSYSSISCYMLCPARYHYRYRLKLPEESSAAMDRGTRLHGLAEDYMNGNMQCPYELRKIGLKLYQMKEKGALAEREWFVGADWTPNVDDAKIKCVIDVHYVDNDVLHILDYKSGREYASHAAQLELYAAVGLAIYPDVKRAQVSALYIDSGNVGAQDSIIRPMLPTIRKNWDNKIALMEADNDFLAAPGSHCKWCPFGISKGGPCAAEGLDNA